MATKHNEQLGLALNLETSSYVLSTTPRFSFRHLLYCMIRVDLKTNKVVRRDVAGKDAWPMLENLEGKHRPSEFRQQSLHSNLPVVVQAAEE